MAVNSGFFNSIGGDRVYDAESVNEFFEGFVTDGVLSPVGGWLQVQASGGIHGGMEVSVESGKAWFLKSWLTNTQTKIMNLASSDVNFDRWDIVALDFDKANRENSIIVLTGTPDEFTPQLPTLINTSVHIQIPLAHIEVKAGVTEILAIDITNKIGVSDECPFATGILEQASAEDMLVQWNAEFNEWMASIEDDILEMDTSGTLAELEDMRARAQKGRNIIINGDMSVNQRTIYTISGYDQAASAADNYPGIADRWCPILGPSSGEWDLEQRDRGQGRYSWKATCAVPATLSNGTSRFFLQQRIEGNMLGELHKGLDDGKDMTLSFKFATNRAGTYIVEVYDQHHARSISNAITHFGNGAFLDYEIEIPADFTGMISHDNTRAMDVTFWFLAGSEYTDGTALNEEWNWANAGRRAKGQVNAGATVGGYVEITEVQLEIGSLRTAYEREPYHENLARCQRYREYHTAYHMLGSAVYDDDPLVKRLYFFGRQYRTRKRDYPEITWETNSVSVVTEIGGDIAWGTFTVISPPEMYSPDFGVYDFHQEYLAFTANTNYIVEPMGVYQANFRGLLIDAELKD